MPREGRVDNRDFVQAVRSARLTLEELAERLGVSRKALDNYVQSRRAIPPDVRSRLASVLDAHGRGVIKAARSLRGSVRD